MTKLVIILMMIVGFSSPHVWASSPSPEIAPCGVDSTYLPAPAPITPDVDPIG